MRTPKWFNGRSGLVVLALLALCFAAITFGQSSGSNHGQAFGLGKLEPALEVLNVSNIDPNAVAGVIVQFEDDAMPGDTAEVTKDKKLARRAAILAAGGEVDRDYDNFPAHSAKLTFKALQKLEKHPFVSASTSTRCPAVSSSCSPWRSSGRPSSRWSGRRRSRRSPG